MSDLRQVLEQTIAAAECVEEWRPPQGDYPPLISVQTKKLVTVIPTQEWSNLVFAIHDHLASRSGEVSR